MKIIVELETDKLSRDALIQVIRQMDDADDLSKLAECSEPSIKSEIAINQNTSPECLDRLSKEKTFITRWAIAGHKKAPESALLRLATDTEFLIRERISERERLPDKVVIVLSKDKDEMIREFAKRELERRKLQ